MEADLDGLCLMSISGYDIKEIVNFWNKVKDFKDGMDGRKIEGLRSSHPFLEDRIINLGTLIEKNNFQCTEL